MVLYVMVSWSKFGPGDARAAKDFPRAPQGPPKGPPGKIPEKLPNAIYIYVSCVKEFYRVLKLSKINETLAGKRFV